MATVLFVVPHQDDELLTLGAAVSNHVDARHDVHIALLTDGGNSGVRPQLGMGKPQFVSARDDEWRRSCRALGVPAEHLHISRMSTEDGQLTAARATDAISALLRHLPGAWVKTHTYRPLSGRHPDHIAVGHAAHALWQAGVIANLRLYVEPYHVTAYRATYGPVGTEAAATPARVQAAVAEYRRVDHAAGMWGIGDLSVPGYLDLIEANPTSYVHVP